MVRDETKYVWLYVSVLMFIVGFLPSDTPAQQKSQRLKLSILNVEKHLSPTSVLRIRVDNLSKRTLRISQITLSLRSSDDVNRPCNGPCFFAHIPLSKKNVRKGRSIEVEIRLDDRHWFYTNSQTFMYSPQPPNFHERFKGGDYQLLASILCQPLLTIPVTKVSFRKK